MKRKLLFVNSSLTGGGSERVMTLLANEFANNQKYDVTMVLLREKNEETYKINENINCIRFYYKTKNKVLIAIKRIAMLRKLIKKYHFDNIISFMYDINITTLISCIGLEESIIISERADPSARKHSKIYKWIEHKLYLKAKNIVFQTEDVKKMFSKDIQNKSVVISNPVNRDLPEYFSGEREKNIVAAGRITYQKNFKMLINAFAKFHEIYKDYKLTIYGEGQLLQSLKEQAKEKNISENVMFPGFVINVNENMQKACMYISTSNYEGISNSMIEALAMGIPTICTDCPVGGAAMMIQNEINGILIPVGDEEALINSMKRIVEDKEFAIRISQKAIEIRKKYSIENVAKQWEKLFK